LLIILDEVVELQNLINVLEAGTWRTLRHVRGKKDDDTEEDLHCCPDISPPVKENLARKIECTVLQKTFLQTSLPFASRRAQKEKEKKKTKKKIESVSRVGWP